MTKAILSVKYPQFEACLQKLGYEIIPTEEIPCKMPYERDHADLQCLILHDTAFILNRCHRLVKALSDDYRVIECGERFGSSYPDNVVLSAVKLANQLICRTDSLDDRVKAYSDHQGYELINVKQGYAKCACVQAADHAIITADNGIIQTLLNHKEIDVLPIGERGVRLGQTYHGFIGGASGYDRKNHTLYFCGDISRHPDCDRIKQFCKKYNTHIISLTDSDLIDIGGIVFC